CDCLIPMHTDFYHFSPFFFSGDGHPRDLHSFPTRRSSDLHRESGLRASQAARAGVGSAGSRSALPGAAFRSKDSRHRRSHGKSVDRKSTRLNSSHSQISYAVFCLKKKKKKNVKIQEAYLSN